MKQLNNIAMSDRSGWAADHETVSPRVFNNPPVVDIFERIAGHLLLVGAATAIFISDWIVNLVGVKPTWNRFTGHSAKSDLRAERDIQGLPLSDPR